MKPFFFHIFKQIRFVIDLTYKEIDHIRLIIHGRVMKGTPVVAHFGHSSGLKDSFDTKLFDLLSDAVHIAEIRFIQQFRDV